MSIGLFACNLVLMWHMDALLVFGKAFDYGTFLLDVTIADC